VGGLPAPAVGAIANASTLQLALLSLVVLPALSCAAARGMIDPRDEPRPQQTVASIGV
jgi:FSR family fosmidomycin resistance protein-like MFS transporter